MFFIFIKACKKYMFDYTLNANYGLVLTLHPKNSFGNIEIKQEYYKKNYYKLFYKAIKKMKSIREERGY